MHPGFINIYTQDRAATVNSFSCYWTISWIKNNKLYYDFDCNVLVQKVNKGLFDLPEIEPEHQLDGQNFKKVYKMPKDFLIPPRNPSDGSSPFDLKRKPAYIDYREYSFFLPRDYQQNQSKETQFEGKKDVDNKIITLGRREPQPIDFMEKMIDKNKEIKYICENSAFDFIKNTQNENEVTT